MIIIVLGAFAVAYTFLGGMKAVIWTDVIQFCTLFGGMALAAVLIIFKIDGGVEFALNSPWPDAESHKHKNWDVTYA